MAFLQETCQTSQGENWVSLIWCNVFQSGFGMMVKSRVGRHEGGKKHKKQRRGLSTWSANKSQLPNPEAAFSTSSSAAPQTLSWGSRLSRKDSRAADASQVTEGHSPVQGPGSGGHSCRAPALWDKYTESITEPRGGAMGATRKGTCTNVMRGLHLKGR